jgi:hypothetical protein
VSLFDWLLVSHLIGDFLLQTDGMARQKERHWSWMLAHVGSYMVSITLVVVGYALIHRLPVWLTLAVLFFFAGSHVILDRRIFTARWMRFVGISPERPWLSIVADQVFHILTLAIGAQILALSSG